MHIADLEDELAQAKAVYETLATKLLKSRRKAGAELDTRMQQELAPLKMEAAVFNTDIQQADAGPDGADAVLFTVSTNLGAPAGPINKIASGGELSRFLLALKVCLTSRSDGLTLIFDEIDRGVGGATADAVGRRLSSLAKGGQVLVVTHSPQVAALGDHHWVVSKTSDGQETLSSVIKLDDLERTDEIARMLAGDSITDQARAAARALLG
jgi:DNA repair protein RecN (Recombination protein N)